MPSAPILLVIAGPAGSGKSTLCDRLVAADLGFTRVITTTTRAPRDGEINGLHYHFFSLEAFEAKVGAGEFLEWAWVHGKRRYGTLKASVLDPLATGQKLVMSVDVQGVASLRQMASAAQTWPNSLTLFTSIPLTLISRHSGIGFGLSNKSPCTASLRPSNNESMSSHE